MSFLGIAEVLTPILAPIFGIIDAAVLDKDKALELKTSVQTAMISLQEKTLETQKDVIVAEAQGESWLQRNWRPMFMIFLMTNIGLSLIGGVLGMAHEIGMAWDAIPDPAWTLSQIGLGGYIGGRTVEKVAKTVAPAITWKK